MVRSAAGEERLATLRDQIRRFASSSREWRTLLRLAAGGTSLLLGLLVLLTLVASIGVGELLFALLFPILLVCVPLALSLFLLLCFLPVPAAYRRLRHYQLRRRVGSLPRERVAELCLSLRNDPLPDPYAQETVERFMRELQLQAAPLTPTEVSPAAAPAGAGTEVAPPAPRADRVHDEVQDH